MDKENIYEQIMPWKPMEIKLISKKQYTNSYIDIYVTATFTSPNGQKMQVPGFWYGDNIWKVRFAPPAPGLWKWTTKVIGLNDGGLNNQAGEFYVEAYNRKNPIYRHGFLKASENGRGFIHEDGTPFFWLGDTVWSISARATTDEWKEYINFRSKQGFNLVQINALPQHDASGTDYREPFAITSSGWDLTRPNQEYFEYLDQMMEMTMEAGMITAMVVLWCDYVSGTNPSWNIIRKANFSEEQAQLFGQYLGARYGSFGTVWLITGDTDFIDSQAIGVYDAAAKGIQDGVPNSPLMTAHLNGGIYTPDVLNAKDWLSFHMYQSSHSKQTKENALFYAKKDRAYEPIRPVLNGEPCYEQLGYHMLTETIERETVRDVAWNSILGGGNAGITYGAHGLWSWHRQGEFFSNADQWHMPPDWREALKFEGAEDMVRMKNFFTDIPWWELEPANDLLIDKVDKQIASADNGRQIIIVYISQADDVHIKVKANCSYEGKWFNPVNGDKQSASVTILDSRLTVQAPTSTGEWVLTIKNIEFKG